jgi:hypothetical protein
VLAKRGARYLSTLGYDTPETFRTDKQIKTLWWFIEHSLEVNDVIISAAMLKIDNPDYWLQSFVHERELKRKPYKVSWKGNEITLIPDAILDFRAKIDGGERRLPVMLEHEISPKGEFAFKKKLRAYIALLRERFQNTPVTIAYITALGPNYLGKIREWAWQELHSTNETESLGKVFCFTAIQKPIDPAKLWLAPVWYTPYDEPPISLLGV